MNRYALWKYIVIAVALLFGVIYTVPNFFGEAPAVQVSSAKATVRVNPSTRERVETTLRTANVPFDSALFETVGLNSTVRVRLQDTDTQLKAKDAIEHGFNPDPTIDVARSADLHAGRAGRRPSRIGCAPIHRNLRIAILRFLS